MYHKLVWIAGGITLIPTQTNQRINTLCHSCWKNNKTAPTITIIAIWPSCHNILGCIFWVETPWREYSTTLKNILRWCTSKILTTPQWFPTRNKKSFLPSFSSYLPQKKFKSWEKWESDPIEPGLRFVDLRVNIQAVRISIALLIALRSNFFHHHHYQKTSSFMDIGCITNYTSGASTS